MRSSAREAKKPGAASKGDTRIPGAKVAAAAGDEVGQNGAVTLG